jgi:uncharacterized protein (DUF427 family)
LTAGRRIEPSTEHLVVELGGQTVAETSTSVRVLEGDHPPVYYLPRSAFADGVIEPNPSTSTTCPWKGAASYGSLRAGGRVAADAVWWYADPLPDAEPLRDHIAVYPGRVDACSVDGSPVTPEPGGYYGGWIVAD